ncbi:unnamed protein product, partial [Linum tenue]
THHNDDETHLRRRLVRGVGHLRRGPWIILDDKWVHRKFTRPAAAEAHRRLRHPGGEHRRRVPPACNAVGAGSGPGEEPFRVREGISPRGSYQTPGSYTCCRTPSTCCRRTACRRIPGTSSPSPGSPPCCRLW